MLRLLILILPIARILAQNCSFTTTANSPIITNDFTFPDSFNYELDELLYITCPKGTTSPFLLERGDHVICKGGTSILMVRTVELLDFSSFICTPASITVSKTQKRCEGNGTVIEIGFEVEDNIVPEIEVCFNEQKLAPFYTKYRNRPRLSLNGFTYEEYICGLTRQCMFTDNSDMYHDISVDLLYYDQVQILQNLGVQIHEFDLVKFPLAQDFFAHELLQEVQSFPSWEHIQVVPIWNYNLAVYLWVSRYSEILANDGTFRYTGSLDVAIMPNANDELVEIYLNGNQVPAPKWIWMVDEMEQTVIFIHNTAVNITELNYESFKGEAALLCTDPEIESIQVQCNFDNLVHSEMKEFIRNKFCKLEEC